MRMRFQWRLELLKGGARLVYLCKHLENGQVGDREPSGRTLTELQKSSTEIGEPARKDDHLRSPPSLWYSG